jgi:hypothetical protein
LDINDGVITLFHSHIFTSVNNLSLYSNRIGLLLVGNEQNKYTPAAKQ